MSSMQRSMKMRAMVASVLISASTKRVFCISISAWPNALRSRVCSTVSLQRPLDRGHAGHAEDGALVRQLGHQLGEALPFDAAQHVVERHVGVVEEQLAGVLPLLPDFFEDAADPEARIVLRLEQQQRHAARAGVRIGLDHDDDQVGQVAVRDEGLGAVDAVAVRRPPPRWCGCLSGRSRRPVRTWRSRRPSRRWPAAAGTSASAPRCPGSGCSGRRWRARGCRTPCRRRSRAPRTPRTGGRRCRPSRRTARGYRPAARPSRRPCSTARGRRAAAP